MHCGGQDKAESGTLCVIQSAQSTQLLQLKCQREQERQRKSQLCDAAASTFISVGKCNCNSPGAHALDSSRSFMPTVLTSECGDRSLVNRGAAVDNQCTIAPVKPCLPRPGPCEFRNPAKFKVHSEVCWQVSLFQLVPVVQFWRSALV